MFMYLEPRGKPSASMAAALGLRSAALLLLLLLFCLHATASVACPEDSVAGEDGECKCVAPCPPRRACQPGQQPVLVREAIPERPGRCCPLYECRDQATLSWQTQDDSGAVLHCMDGSGQPREIGERWLDLDDPCINCTCETGGRLSCYTTMCRSCANPEPRQPGECCPKCPALPSPCPPLPEDCGQLNCELGLDVDVRSGCTVCSCRSKLQNDVDDFLGEDDCPPLTSCELECEHGLLLEPNGCQICQCRPKLDCSASIVCQHKCPHGYRINWRGCPSCRCRASCVDERNVTRPEGASWSSGPCRSCSCDYSGQISCNETLCSLGCAEPLPPPSGKCCPVCPPATDELSRGWGTVPIVLIVVLALLCVLLMVHLVRNRFRARLAPSEADFGGYPQQYYKCVPVYEPHVPVLQHAGKIAPL